MNSSGIMNIRRAFAVVLALVVLPCARGEEDAFHKWWNSQTVTGDMLGVRPAMEDHGLSLNGRWRGIYYGILSSENGSGASALGWCGLRSAVAKMVMADFPCAGAAPHRKE